MSELLEGLGAQIMVEDGRANLIFDMSKIDLFEVCHFRYHCRYNLKRGLPISEKSPSLDKGTLAHLGLEEYYNGLKFGIHYNDRMHACLQKIRATASDVNQSALETKDVLELLHAVEESCDYWRGDDENFMEVLEVETPFAYSLYEDKNIRIIISGKIDLLVNIREHQGSSGYMNCPIDHKTHSRNFEAPRMSNQFINYCVATGSNYLHVNKIGLQQTLPPEKKYNRVPYSYDPLLIADWKQNMASVILNEMLPCIADNEWTQNFTSCLKYNRLCEYYDVCNSSGQEAKLWKLDSQYVELEEWDVTKGLDQ